MFVIYGDDNLKDQKTPVLVYTLIALNVMFYLIQLFDYDRMVYGGGVVPYEIIHGTDLVGPTTQHRTETAQINHYPAPLHPWMTVLSSMFLHGSLFHLGGNMLFLWIFGDQVEHALGRLRFAMFYLIGGTAACLSQVLVHSESQVPMIGASGAIAGVLGAYLVLHPRNKVYVMIYCYLEKWEAWAALTFWFVAQTIGAIFAAERGVAYMAHIGGFIFGVALIKVFAWTLPTARSVPQTVTPAPQNSAESSTSVEVHP